MALSRHDLFIVDPNEFVARRDELVRALRADGDKTGAADVKKLRRPAVAVWALNQAAALRDDLVRHLVDTANRARDAQRTLLEGGDAAEFRSVLADRRQAVAALSAATGAVIAESGRSPDTYARDVEDTLNSVVASAELCAAMRRSELPALPSGPADGSEMFADVTIGPRSPRRSPPRLETPEAAPEPPRPTAELTNARVAVERDERELSKAERDLDAADAAVVLAEADAAEARRLVARSIATRDTVRAQRDELSVKLDASRTLLEQLESG